MRTQRWLLLTVPMLLAACQRAPEPPASAAAEQTQEAAQAPTARGRAAAQDTARDSATDAGADTADAAGAATATSPGQVVRSYVSAVLHRDAAAIDRLWQLPTRGGRPPDDAALHALRQVRSLRVTAGTPVPRDGQQPSRLLEVPVRIQAVTADGRFLYEGWYRLVPGGDGGWLIQSAQLQPILE